MMARTPHTPDHRDTNTAVRASPDALGNEPMDDTAAKTMATSAIRAATFAPAAHGCCRSQAR